MLFVIRSFGKAASQSLAFVMITIISAQLRKAEVLGAYQAVHDPKTL